MKTAIALLILACSLPLHAAGSPLKALIGQWSGTHKETQNGAGQLFKTTLEGKKRSNGAVALTEKTESGYVFKYRFSKNGKFWAQTSISNVVIVSTYSGKWKAKNGKITISGKGTSGRLSGILATSKSRLKFNGKAGSLRITVKARR
jgi:hypothetical protein